MVNHGNLLAQGRFLERMRELPYDVDDKVAAKGVSLELLAVILSPYCPMRLPGIHD